MIASLAALALAVLATGTRTDTTFAVRPGARLELNNFSGSVAIQTWSKNSVRVAADHSSRTWIEVAVEGPVIDLHAEHQRGMPIVDYQLTVPKWMSLEISGVSTDVSVENTEGEVTVETVHGEVSVTGGARIIRATSVEGEVRVIRAAGKIEASSVNAAVRLDDCSGQIAASSINGEVLLRNIVSGDVEASTINGEVTYQGEVKDGGSYHFSSHGGDLSVVIPERASVSVTVATYNGEFSSTFPITLNEVRKGKRRSFTLGGGSARMELESFQGDIRLRRPGDPETRRGGEFRHESRSQGRVKAKEKEKSTSKAKHDGESDEGHEP